MIVGDERVLKFVSDALGVSLFPPFTVIGIEKNNEIVAGVVFNCFEGADVHITVAGHGWNRGFYAEVGDYVFRQLGYGRMTAITEDHKVARLAEKLGGQIEGRMRNHFGAGRDAFIIGILKDEYRF